MPLCMTAFARTVVRCVYTGTSIGLSYPHCQVLGMRLTVTAWPSAESELMVISRKRSPL